MATLAECDKVIAEDFLAREAGDQFADDAHAGQNHDVNRRVRIEPEQMLEQHGVAAQFGIEDADPPEAFDRHERECHREHRRRQDHDDAGRIHGPQEQR